MTDISKWFLSWEAQWSVIEWVTKIYYLELLRASEWHVKPLVPAAFAVVSTRSSFKEGWSQAGGQS
jgi:hypothetical protein